MEYMSFLKNRRSVREFRDEELRLEEVQALDKAIDDILESGADEFVRFSRVKNQQGFYEDLIGKAGYAGVMIQAPEYIIMEYKEIDTRNVLEGAVFASELVTLLKDLELDTCWITLGEATKDVREDHFGLVADNIAYAIGVGKAKEDRPYSGEKFSTRKSVDEIAFLDHDFSTSATDKLKDLNMLELFSALKYAPSHKNLQPWKFVIENDKITIYLEKGSDLINTLTDGGIIMYYFQRMAQSMGIKHAWEINIEDMGDYYRIGQYRL